MGFLSLLPPYPGICMDMHRYRCAGGCVSVYYLDSQKKPNQNMLVELAWFSGIVMYTNCLVIGGSCVQFLTRACLFEFQNTVTYCCNVLNL